MVIHTVQIPVQPILSLTEVIRSKIKDTEVLELQDVIIRSARILKRLTEDILDVTRIESQSLKLDKVNLTDVITEALVGIGTNREFKSETNLKIIYQPQDIFVEADRSRITQVITNLLNNAVKFMKEDGSSGGDDGTITITVEKKENSHEAAAVVVTVKDTGTGIDPGILPRLFDKFASKSYQGTGLGLFISKIVEKLHFTLAFH